MALINEVVKGDDSLKNLHVYYRVLNISSWIAIADTFL